MSTPALTTTIVATETVHLTIPILVGTVSRQELFVCAVREEEREVGEKHLFSMFLSQLSATKSVVVLRKYPPMLSDRLMCMV